MTILYFGCIKQKGHFLYEGDGGSVNGARFELSNMLFNSLDGAFCPPGGTPPQRYLVSSVPPWIIISWRDYSIDSRPGSHSTFLFKPEAPSYGYSANVLIDPIFQGHLLGLAKERFPSVFERQPTPTPL